MNISKDIKYFKKCVDVLPHHYTGGDTNRMTLAFFGLSGLDLLSALDENITPEDRDGWINWIYAQQIHPDESEQQTEEALAKCGFRGAPFGGAPFDPVASRSIDALDYGHIAMNYTALANLLILGDDLSRVNRKAIVKGLKYLQQPNGTFCAYWGSSESDMRFLYCACAVSFMLNDWSGVDKERAIQYIISSQNYDHAFGQGPGLESHGGSTYCAIGSLKLMGALDRLERKDELIQWCLNRQETGFQGRLNKPPDTCYAFWIGATLQMLGAYKFVHEGVLKDFLKETHFRMGGFGKHPDALPDLMHSYMGLAGLSFTQDSNLRLLDPALNISMRAFQHFLTTRM